MRVERVPYPGLPGLYPRAFAALSAGDPALRGRVACLHRDEAGLLAHARKAAARGADPGVLAKLPAGPARDRLAAGAAAVVTGQQPSVLLGPLYNLYKAAGAIKISRWLSSKGVPAVPVFWNHSDDDHVEGLGHLELPAADNSVAALDVPLAEGPVLASLEVPGAVELLAPLLPETPHKAGVVELLRSATRGRLAADFTSLLSALFGDELLVVEPAQLDGPRAREVFRRALAAPGNVQALVKAGGEVLEAAGFEAPLGGNLGTCVYVVENGRRRRVERSGSDLAVDGAVVPLDDLLARRLSAGVALRPVLQDSVLPTAAYVGGPHECAYLLQLAELYREHGLPGPVIWPRITATILEARVSRPAEKLEFRTGELLLGEARLADLRAGRSTKDLLADVSRLELDVKGRLAGLEERLRRVEPPLVDLGRKTGEKAAAHLSAFRERIVQAQGRADAVAAEQVRKIAAHVTPKGRLQERAFTPWYYRAMFGPGFLDEVLGALDVFADGHQVVRPDL